MKPCTNKNPKKKTKQAMHGNQKVKSVIETEVTVRSPFITYSSQNPCNFPDMEVIMIKENDNCLGFFQFKSIRVTFSSEKIIYKCYK